MPDFKQPTEETDAFGADKIDRYAWQLQDAPGEFMEIDKDDLVIDHTYQREAAESKVLNIARDWSWVACGALLVAHRRGKYAVMDGSYRTLASRRRSDIQSLPCMVFQIKTIEKEALGFLGANTNRKPVSALDKFRALLTIGDKAALLLQKLADDSARTIGGNRGNSIDCVRCLLKWAENEEEILVRLWPIIDKLSGDQRVHNRLVEGLLELERRLNNDNISLCDTGTRWKARLFSIGAEQLIGGANKASAYYEKGGQRVWATGILNIINHNLRNKLKAKGL